MNDIHQLCRLNEIEFSRIAKTNIRAIKSKMQKLNFIIVRVSVMKLRRDVLIFKYLIWCPGTSQLKF